MTSNSSNSSNSITDTTSPTIKELHPKLILSPSKAHDYFFTKIRDKNTSSEDFVKYSRRSMRILVEDALAEFPTNSIEFNTPCGPCTGIERCIDGKVISKSTTTSTTEDNATITSSSQSSRSSNLCAVSIVRSGDALVDIVRECEPSCMVGKILIQRNEESITKEAILYYHKLPLSINSSNTYVLLCDPMLATGGSAIIALNLLCTKYYIQPCNIIFATVICCPEGLQTLAIHYPDITIVTIKVDSHLNDNKYIVPGLGDFGDRYYHTI